jgi:4'-phosphopantetheinyl transferase EntD
VRSLQDLFSDAVVAIETRRCQPDESMLWPEEREALGPVGARRFRDYALGRWCARQAIERLGMEPAPILRGSKRQPLWPAGVVGTITHTSGYAAAAVASDLQLRSIGIDAEPDEPLPGGVLGRIARPEDLEWVHGSVGLGVGHRDRLLFSAKEAVYKAWFPVAGTWLGFADARLSVDPVAQTFRADILVDGPLASVDGRFAAIGGMIVTSVEVVHTQVVGGPKPT